MYITGETKSHEDGTNVEWLIPSYCGYCYCCNITDIDFSLPSLLLLLLGDLLVKN
jgi:hypothetical protein